MIELHKNGKDWWVDGHVYTPEQFAIYISQKDEQDTLAFEDMRSELAAKDKRLAEAEELFKRVLKEASDRALIGICGLCTNGPNQHGDHQGRPCPIPDIEDLLSTPTNPDKVLVMREDLEIASMYLFNRKSLPLVGDDREAGYRLEAASKAALEGK